MLDMRAAPLAAATAAALLAAAGPAAAQPEERGLVVSVTDGDGAPVAGLGAADFVVREDGAQREVLRAARDTRPRQIALLVDTSAAAEGAVGHFRNAVRAFVDALHGDNDIALVGFGGPPRILVPSTRRAANLHEGAGRLFAHSRSAAYLLDAMAETTRGFVRREAPRPVLVVLATEGLDHSSVDPNTVVREIEAAGVTVHTVVLRGGARAPGAFDFGRSRRGPPGIRGGGFGPPGFEPGGLGDRDGPLARWRLDRDLVLDRAPRAGAGRRRDLLASMAAEENLLEVAAELQQQYLVVYSRPAALVPPDDVEVRAARDGLDVRQAAVPEASPLSR